MNGQRLFQTKAHQLLTFQSIILAFRSMIGLSLMVLSNLTLDDGPTQDTDNILKVLKDRNALATFFVTGSASLSNMAALKRAYNDGHQIAMHSFSHTTLTSISDAQIIAETVWTTRVIYQAIGVVPQYFRAPYGVVDDRVKKVINSLNMKLVRWNRDSDDWRDFDSTARATEWGKDTKSSGIILQHEFGFTVNCLT
jgi:peptidoglycan/xylan/chitin deacetylase (PgdA/CDA1 family)